MDKEPTPLNTIGEFGIIDRIKKHTDLKNQSSILGIGDDAAIVKSGEESMLLCTDTLVEGVHFDLLYTPLKHLGYKAVIVNLSDIYAMNALPEQILVSLAVSNRMSVEGIDEIYEGIKLACDMYQVDLVGGDTTSSLSGTVITVTAVGKAFPSAITKRSGAIENDLICVSGDLGAAFMGLQILEREKQIFKENSNIQPDLSGKDYILERQLKPEARKDIVHFLKENNILPTSMIDISDGLSSDLLHLAKSSEVGVQIYEEKIPLDVTTVATAEELNINPILAALNGGEDYELLFTIPITQHDKIKQAEGITIIGHITEKASGYFMVAKGSEELIELKAQGWDHGSAKAAAQ